MAKQSAYVQALATLALVRTELGSFKRKSVKCQNTGCSFRGERSFQTIEEKRTDVAIAVNMVNDANRDLVDHLVLISGDSDLVPALKLIRDTHPTKKISVCVPAREGVEDKEQRRADELRQVAHVARPFPFALLKVCQLPAEVTTATGAVIKKPTGW
jgi:uncharacterized LabA/DUF88 family protein